MKVTGLTSIALVLTCLCSVVNAGDLAEGKVEQEPSIEGKILSLDKVPVAFANVYVKGTFKGAYTDEDGYFAIYDLSKGNYELIVSALGFKKIVKEITLDKNGYEYLEMTFEESSYEMPQITVLGNKERLFAKVPGSANYISSAELMQLQPVSGNEAMRRVPGLHAVDEEGAGLRMNLGIRGLDPDRSRGVHILEDGIPVALAPYGEPEMYYTPSIDRMSGVEVLKGSGQILFGPQTIGGVINFVTANPPEDQEIRVKAQGGQGAFFSGLVSYGNTFGNSGIHVSYMRKQANNLGPTHFRINDVNAKFRQSINEKSELGLKIGVYKETSNSTYIGMTQSMFESGDYDYEPLAPNDELNVSRYSGSLTYQYRFTNRLKLKLTGFAYTTTRNWRRQDFSSTMPSNPTGLIWGDTTISGGAIYMRDGTGNRNRQFQVTGVEPVITYNYNIKSTDNELIGGIRYLYEQANEQRVNGTNANAKSGDLREDEMRSGHAVSAYVQNRMNVTNNFMISAGLRFENFNYERDILRGVYGGIVTDTSVVANSSLNEFIPGIGFAYKPVRNLSLFGGVHHGFSPPRVKDAITAEGEAMDLDAERSWNFELGTRTNLFKGLQLEVTGFYMNFSNQIIPVAESAGGTGTGLVNSGATTHLGVEAAAEIDLGNLVRMGGYNVVYDVNFTFVDARFNSDRFKSLEGESVNISGNRTPYAPRIFFSSALSVTAPFGLGIRFTGNYVGSQFTDELNSVDPSANGRTGEIPSYFTCDATMFYLIKKYNATFNLSVKNITDERYISSRRPQGIRLGLPRFITAGVDFKF